MEIANIIRRGKIKSDAQWKELQDSHAARKEAEELTIAASKMGDTFSNNVVRGFQEAGAAANQLVTDEELLRTTLEQEIDNIVRRGKIKSDLRWQELKDSHAARKDEKQAIMEAEQILDASLAKLRGNLDTTALAWKKSGAKMEDVVTAWSDVTGMSIEDVLVRMDDLDVDTTDLQALPPCKRLA
jgi:DUF1009 family protein